MTVRLRRTRVTACSIWARSSGVRSSRSVAPAARTGRPPGRGPGLNSYDSVSHVDRLHRHVLHRPEQQLFQLRPHVVHGAELSMPSPSGRSSFGRCHPPSNDDQPSRCVHDHKKWTSARSRVQSQRSDGSMTNPSPAWSKSASPTPTTSNGPTSTSGLSSAVRTCTRLRLSRRRSKPAPAPTDSPPPAPAPNSSRRSAERRGTRGPSVLHEAPTPPPTRTPRTCQHEVRAEGNCPAVEFGIKPGDETAKVRPSTVGKPQQNVLQEVSRHQRITALAAHYWIRQHGPWLFQIPLALGQGSDHSPRPQSVLFQLPDRYTSDRRHTADPANRNTSSGPPTLRAQPLRTPTRHRPFGSTSRHPATDRAAVARDQREPAPLQLPLLLTNNHALSGRRVMPKPTDKRSRLRPTQPYG